MQEKFCTTTSTRPNSGGRAATQSAKAGKSGKKSKSSKASGEPQEADDSDDAAGGDPYKAIEKQLRDKAKKNKAQKNKSDKADGKDGAGDDQDEHSRTDHAGRGQPVDPRRHRSWLAALHHTQLSFAWSKSAS